MTNGPITDTTRMTLTSHDVLGDRLDRLRELLPEAFCEGKIDWAKLQQVLGREIDIGRERYGLSWAGKGDAIRCVQTSSVGTLVPCPEESVNFDTTENLFVEGDNLEVLKLLQKSYYGKVKMIYIDPPYNTGNEFIYPDNYREGLEDYLRYSGQVNDDRGEAVHEYRDFGPVSFQVAGHDVSPSLPCPQLAPRGRSHLRFHRRPRGPEPSYDDGRNLWGRELRGDGYLGEG